MVALKFEAKIVVRADLGEVQQRLCKHCGEVVNNWLVNLRRALLSMPSRKPCKKAGPALQKLVVMSN